MDRKRIIGEVAARHGVRLEEDDPAFLLVTIAEIALRDAQAEFLDVARRTIADQEAAADRMQKSIGEALGKSIRRALSDGGTIRSPQPVRVHRRLVLFGVLFGLLLVAAGFAAWSNMEMNLRNWTFLACLFGPRFGFALAVSYYLGGAAIICAAVLAAILYLCG